MRPPAADRQRTAILGRRAFLASLAAMAAGLSVVGAVAYACSGTLNEWTYLSLNSGTHGKSLTVQSWTAGGALYANTGGFSFRYAHPGDTLACAQEAAIGAAVSTNAYGDIARWTRTIPNLGGSKGQTGQACWSVAGSTDPKKISTPTPITLN